MFIPISRRTFIKNTAISSASLISSLYTGNSFAFTPPESRSELYILSRKLLEQWAAALINLQITGQSSPDYGGILCPADKIVHGRVGDIIYPFFYLAHQTNDSKYAGAAHLLYCWMETHVSQEDGSWLNEPKKGSWKGTTVFAAIALAETLKNHGSIMDQQFKNAITDRLKKAGDFIYNTFTIDYGNINYPITASYGLSLLGTLLDIPKFKEKGKDLAHQALRFITPQNGFISGEGDPTIESINKGLYTVDLGYNVEESLPALVLYGLHTKDEEVLDAVIWPLKTHMEFMLPDGGWDNSWGTRNYKWTYWGSRTSDGCQPAYALMAHRDPRFYKAALKNLQLLQQCTKDGLLYGGPHYASHGITPCVHHTFSHIKALATILDYGDHSLKMNVNKISLPRESIYGIRFFNDIQTCLVARGKFKATITTYNREYKATKNGHASGGALTMLWHENAGPLFTASMNEYRLYESDNMQADKDPCSMSLTPRIELRSGDSVYMNICDLNARIETENRSGELIVHTHSKLVNKDQQNPPSGEISCKISYCFTNDKVLINFSYDKSNGSNNENGDDNNIENGSHTTGNPDELIKIILPLISKSTEKITQPATNSLNLDKGTSTVKITSNHPMLLLPTSTGRIFNYVPGFEAIPLSIIENHTRIEIEVNA